MSVMEGYEKINTRDTNPLTIGNYIIMMIIIAIPLLNLIMLFVWAFSKKQT